MARAHFRHRLPAGFTLVELLVVVVIIGCLATAGGIGLLRSARIGSLRTAAVELGGYLESAQASAAGSNNSCSLAISGNGEARRIGPTNDPGNACAVLPSEWLLSGSVIPIGLNVSTTGTLTIAPRGILTSPTPVTIRLSSPSIPNVEYCIQLLPPAGLVGLGVVRDNNCDHAAFN